MGLGNQLKQIIQTEHDIVKNINLSEADQMASYKSGWGPRGGGGGEGVNFFWVCAAGLSEPLPHYSLFCGQL